MRNIIFIKLGGSIITNKNKYKSANLEIISQLIKEISNARKKTNDLIILGHGGGSFPHPPASKYKTSEGFVNKNSAKGLSLVREACFELNLIVLKELIKNQVPTVSLAPFDFVATKNKVVSSIFLKPLLNMLKFNVLPVIYGDAISDEEIGSTIYSTEKLLNILALKLKKYGYNTKLIIEVGKTEGVLNSQQDLISEITHKNYHQSINSLKRSEATDVTGGMLHKVQEALFVARKNIPTLLISAKKNNLQKALLGKPVKGTLIKKS